MTNEELVLMIQKEINVRENMELLWNQNIGLIIDECTRYSGIWSDIEDLRQEAYFGLDKAVKRYKDDKGCKFITYAKYWIRNEIHRYITNDKNIKIPEYLLTKSRKEYWELTQEEIKNLEYAAAISSTGSLEYKVTDDLTVMDTVVDDRVDIENDVIEKVYNEQLYKILWSEVLALPCIEAGVIRREYREGKTHVQISEEMQIKQTKVRHIRERALKRLRQSKRLRQYIGQNRLRLYSKAYRGSLTSFRHTGTSSTEYVAIKMIELEKEYEELTEHLVNNLLVTY